MWYVIGAILVIFLLGGFVNSGGTQATFAYIAFFLTINFLLGKYLIILGMFLLAIPTSIVEIFVGYISEESLYQWATYFKYGSCFMCTYVFHRVFA